MSGFIENVNRLFGLKEQENIIDWGFDNIMFISKDRVEKPNSWIISTSDDFNEFIKKFSLKYNGLVVNPHSARGLKAFEWSNNKVSIYTSIHPATGGTNDGSSRLNQLGFGKYLGITGEESDVKNIVNYIKDNFDYDGESKYSRSYI